MRISKRLWAPLYALALTAFSAYLLLDTFVIPRSYAAVESTSGAARTAVSQAVTSAAAQAAVTGSTYRDQNISVSITQYREYDTDIYVADITLASADALRTAFANGVYGKNITQTTSALAAANGAVLAVNGDYYSARSGYVIRNGVLYRSTSASAQQEDLVIYADGSLAVVREGDVSAEQLLANGAQQVLSFGPGLLENGAVTVAASDEVGRAKTSNPRTAIGMLSPLHYVFVVSDGRTSQSAGLSLYEMAQFLQTLGVQTAYNLDGGGSSTMVFNGAVVNNPTTDGKKISERSVSDIVYIG